jgi:oligopeptide/dipeptide ABC transporter ATP-binding protein
MSADPEQESPPVCEVVDLVKHFGPVHAVDGLSLTVRPGEVVALVGESGSGKSTVGRLVVRLLDPSSGTVLLDGVDVSTLSRRSLRPHRQAVSIVFQDPASSLDPRMSVGDIVAEPLRLHGVRRSDRPAEVRRVLQQVGMRPGVAERYPHELSGGQRQRVSIARALVSKPRLLVADEPTSALDVSVQASVLNLLADLQRDLGFACLFITHDLAAVEYLADRVVVMYLGRVAEVGTREQIFSHPRHPYTQALLSAAPVPDPTTQRRRTRVVLSGELPSQIDPPTGCRFHTRCPLAEDRCRTEVPALREMPSGADTGSVACHLVEDDGSGPDVREPPAAQPRTETTHR